MRISAVVRALNEGDHIGRLLVGMERQSRQPDQVVLVDSGSTDATVSIAERFGCDIVHIDPSEFTFGRSLNLGMQATDGDVVVIPSAHVYPLHDAWIQTLVAPFDDERTALTYGRQVGGDVTKFSEHQVLRRWFPEQSNLDQKHPFCNNANAAVRREVWEELRYDETLTGLEDLEFAKRALEAGHRIAYIAEAVVAHIHDETWDQVQNRYRREAIAYKRVFEDEHVSLLESARLMVTNTVSDLAAARREGDLAGEAGNVARFRLAQFVGAWQGFRQKGDPSEDLKQRFYYPPREHPEPKAPEGIGNPIDYGEEHG